MIPVGSPVTVTWAQDRKTNHTVRYVSPENKHSRYHLDGMWIAHEDIVKIRYDNPCPFTLWSWNTELKLDANAPWYSMFGDLNPKSITDYRKVVASWGKIS